MFARHLSSPRILVACLSLVLGANVAAADAPRLHWVLGGHGSQVRAVAVSPDGELVASASEDGTVKIWRTSDGRLRSTLVASEFQSFAANGVAFSPDGSLIAGTGTGGGRVWRVADGQPVASLPGFETGYGIAFSAGGTLVGLAGSITGLEEAAGIFRVSDGAMLLEFVGTINFYGISIAFSPDELSFFISSGSPFMMGQPGAIKRVRISDGQVLQSFVGHTRRVGGLAISPDGATLASSSEDSSIRFWNVADGAPIGVIPAAHAGEIGHVAFSADGMRLASSGGDALTRIWNMPDRSLARTITGHVGPISSAAFTAGGGGVVTAGGRTFGGGGDHTIRRWRLADGVEESRFTSFTARGPLLAHAAQSGRLIASDGSASVRIFDDRAGALVQSVQHGEYVTAVGISPDGERAASIGLAPPVRLWNVATGQQYATIALASAVSPGVAFSPDGATIAAGSWHVGLSLYRASDGGFVRALAQSAPGGRDPAFSHDGTLIAATNGSSAMVWRMSDGVRLRVFPVSGLEAQRVAFSPDDQNIAVGGSGPNVRIFRVSDGTLVRQIVSPAWSVRSLAYSPDGTYLLTGAQYYNHMMHVWRLSDGALVATIDEQNGTGVEDLAFTSDGRRLVLSRLDGVVTSVFHPLVPPCDGDVDADGSVGLADLSLLLSHFGTSIGGSPATGDLDDDGDVDLSDLATLLSAFGAGCS